MTSLGRSPPRSKKESSNVHENDAGETDADENDADETEPEPLAPTPETGEEIRPDTRQIREQAKLVAKARRDEARQKTRAARAEKAAARAAKRDRIVEAPREPKKSLTQRLNRDATKTSKAPKTSKAETRAKRPASRRILSLVAGLVGALGLVCSITLAVGALLVARGANGSGFYDTIEGICNVLVGPLRDVFSFSGKNADMKESLVVWGAGSIVYLVVGLVAQSVLRSAADDK